MKMNVYTVLDVQANRAILPLFRQNDEVALRDFTNTCVNPESPFHANPDDYALFHIDEWDDESMTFTGGFIPRRLITGREALATRKIDTDKIAALHREIEEIKASIIHDHAMSPGGTA